MKLNRFLVETPQTMETLDQNAGFILYVHDFPGTLKGDLIIKGMMDNATVYINGKQLGMLDRRLNQHKLSIEIAGGVHHLEILVEHQARVSFGNAIDHERKGITEGVYINDQKLKGWNHYNLPVDNIQ